MKVKLLDFSGVVSTLVQMGYLDDEGQPTSTFFVEAAQREADKLLDGYLKIFKGDSGLEFVRDLMFEFVMDENSRALGILLNYVYDRSGNEQPDFFSLLNTEERIDQFCAALVAVLDNMLG